MAGLMDYLSNLKFEPDAKSMGLMNMGANMLNASSMSPTPVGFGNVMGSGLNGFVGGYQTQKNLEDTQAAAEQKKLMDAATINHLNAQAAHERSPSVPAPGAYMIPAGAVEATFGGQKGYRLLDGSFIPSIHGLTENQSLSQSPEWQGAISSAREGSKTNPVKMNDGSTQMLTNNQANSNYNYGNIREPNQTTGFQSFSSPQEGIASIDKNLQAYGSQHGINTLAGVISRWSPPNENDTPNLIKNAAQRLGIGPDDPIDLNNPVTRQLVSSAIMMQEQPRTNLFPAPQGNGLSIGQSTADEAQVKADIENKKAMELALLKKQQGNDAIDLTLTGIMPKLYPSDGKGGLTISRDDNGRLIPPKEQMFYGGSPGDRFNQWIHEYNNDSDPKAQNLTAIRRAGSDLVLQANNGTLGVGVSNADVAFLKEMQGILDKAQNVNDVYGAFADIEDRVNRIRGKKIDIKNNNPLVTSPQQQNNKNNGWSAEEVK